MTVSERKFWGTFYMWLYVNTYIYHQCSTVLSGLLLLLCVSGGYPHLYQQSPPCNCSPSLPPSSQHYSPNCQGSSSSVLSRNSASARSAIHSRNSKPFGGRSFVPEGRAFRKREIEALHMLQKLIYKSFVWNQMWPSVPVCVQSVYIRSMWKCTPYSCIVQKDFSHKRLGCASESPKMMNSTCAPFNFGLVWFS